ncbi:MAG: M61 family peptidase [Gammaproteobacteria bacterium]|nr:M61 family peptidase [Gammaproteobacteria bacterium]MBU6508971.1 M61 family peptidase [Gammaproteobacteria bacterium]MDE1984410.1 M61 family metallopeptidase [Gammaproteobacteria bacterium]MDE2109194.1 M61 family metallopeptidase [Gammaproteobacteria bacterium]
MKILRLPLLGLGLAALCFSVLAAEPNANAVPYATRDNPEILVLDARDAPRGLMTASMTIPVKPGPFTFVYPKWIPGEHGPTGPLNDISQLKVSANGQALSWHRDQVDMYAFHVDVPAGTSKINVQFTVLMNAPGDVMATPNLFILNWNRVLFYQNDTNSSEVYFKPSIILPKGWSYGTALPGPQQSGNRVDFAEVPLNMLVDSPLDAGIYYKHIELWRQGDAYQMLDIFADKPQDLDIPNSLIAEYKRMTPEALALYSARHWNDYHSLLALSNAVGFQGIEHHQSSDDRAPDNFMTKPDQQLVSGDLLTHEFSHSWNGKYRRPFDLWQPNFQIPEHTELLWVYEGMNQYLGDLLSFRMGIRKPDQYPEYLAMLYAAMATEPGRKTEPLIDTTTAAPYLYEARGAYPEIRRTAGDFYTEGELLWLDVDTIIREKTHGEKSLDTFLHLYAGPPNTGPITKTYTRADIEKLLNEVAPYDWHAFFQKHVYEVADLPPTTELARAGWKLVYTAEPNAFIKAGDGLDNMNNQWYSYGIKIRKDGTVTSVREGSPAWQAGMAPGMQIKAVDGQSYSKDTLNFVLKQAEHSTTPTIFLVKQDGWYKTLDVNYHGGPRYPHLARIPDTTDMLAKIMAPQAGNGM